MSHLRYCVQGYKLCLKCVCIQIASKLDDKLDDFSFPIIINFLFISSNIPTSPTYGVYISQLIRYSRACAQYSDFLDWAELLTLLKQGYVAPRLKSSLQKFYGGHHNLVESYEISIPQMTMDLLLFTRCFLSSINAGLDSIYE